MQKGDIDVIIVSDGKLAMTTCNKKCGLPLLIEGLCKVD